MIKFRSAFCAVAIVGLSAGPVVADTCKCSDKQGRSSSESGEETVPQSSARSGRAFDGLGKAAPGVKFTGPDKGKAAESTPADAKGDGANGGSADADAAKPDAGLRATREASLRRIANMLGMNYDTMLEDAGVSEDDSSAGPNGGTQPAEPRGDADPAAQRRFDGQRLRLLARHVLNLATEDEVQNLLLTLSPDPKVAIALKIISRVGTVVKGKVGESATEGDLSEEHDLAKLNPQAFAEALDEELAASKNAEQIELLRKKQAAEIELLEKRHEVERSERSLTRARAAAEAAEKAVNDATKAQEPQPPATGQ